MRNKKEACDINARQERLKRLQLPLRYNYIACFLTLDCNFNCDYCINWFNGTKKHKETGISGKEWVEGLNRLDCPDDLPITIQGGEPAMHPDFIWIIKNIRMGLNVDILTNLSFNVEEFIKSVNPLRLRREAPYPSIRVSYHPSHADLDVLMAKVLKMQHAGFSIGIFGILHPDFEENILKAQQRCIKAGIDFRTKEFLGEFRGRLCGTYLYPEAIGGSRQKSCFCRTSELIIGPEGNIYRCHHDLYEDSPAIGNLLDPNFEIIDIFRECSRFGECNPCDMKVKTDRFQVYGYTAVEIKDIQGKGAQ